MDTTLTSTQDDSNPQRSRDVPGWSIVTGNVP